MDLSIRCLRACSERRTGDVLRGIVLSTEQTTISFDNEGMQQLWSSTQGGRHSPSVLAAVALRTVAAATYLFSDVRVDRIESV